MLIARVTGSGKNRNRRMLVWNRTSSGRGTLCGIAEGPREEMRRIAGILSFLPELTEMLEYLEHNLSPDMEQIVENRSVVRLALRIVKGEFLGRDDELDRKANPFGR